jgi:hypothetical protein
MTVVTFFFTNVWHFLGLVLVLETVGSTLVAITRSLRPRSPAKAQLENSHSHAAPSLSE